MVSLEINGGYVPPKGTKTNPTRQLLLTSTYRDIFATPITRYAFLAEMIVSALLITLVTVISHSFVVFFVLFTICVLFHFWVTYQLLIYARGLNSKRFIDTQPQHLIEDGWYPDPWGNGVPRLRYYKAGTWTDEVKTDADKMVKL